MICSIKDPVKGMKGQATNEEEIFANCLSDKGLVPTIYILKTSELNIKKMNNAIRKWAKQTFHRRQYTDENTST